MRKYRWLIGLIFLVGVGLAGYFLKPVNGPARDLTLVGNTENGAYMLRLGGCVACHTDVKNEGAFMAGGAPLVTPFGSFVPPNITSHAEGGIGNWSLAQFSDAISDGAGSSWFDHYYPSFPYDSYTLLSDQDVADLFVALKEIEPVAEKAPEHSVMFPFNIRLAMLGWKNLFFTPQRYQNDNSRSELWNRGAYLANGPAHCVACHTPRNIFGARDDSRHLMGSPAGTPAGRVPAIDSASLIAAGYDAAWIVDVLTGGVTPEFDVPGGAMFEVISEGTSKWTDDDLNAIAAYLLNEG